MNNVERFDELYNINTMTTQKGSFFRLQKILFENEELKELSLEAKVLYAILIYRMKDRLKSSVGCISITIPSLKVLHLEKKVKLQKRRFLQLHSYSHQTGLYGIWSKTVWGVYG